MDLNHVECCSMQNNGRDRTTSMTSSPAPTMGESQSHVGLVVTIATSQFENAECDKSTRLTFTLNKAWLLK